MPSAYDRIVPLPRTLQLLTTATLLISAVDFVLGMLDLGTAGFFLNIAAAGFTFVHDLTIVLYARRLFPNQTPMFFPPASSTINLMVLGACVLMYTAGFAMTVYSTIFVVSGDIGWGTPASAGTIIAQDVLASSCAILLLYTAWWCWRARAVGRQFGYDHLF